MNHLILKDVLHCLCNLLRYVPDVEQVEVIEGLQGKMKGLEQTILTEQNAVLGLRDMFVGLIEKVDSSLGTALTSPFNTSGLYLGKVSIL